MARVLVVGAGLAGAMAALAAARRGAEVTQVWRAPGATALGYGALAFDADLAALPPDHPLTRLDADPVRLGTFLDEAVGALQSGLAAAGLRLEGGWRRSGRYADLHGRAHTAALVPALVGRGELAGLRGRRVAVVGFDAVSDYDAESTAGTLKELNGIDAFPVVAPVDGIPPGGSLTDLAGRAAPGLGQVRAEAIAFPPGLEGLPERGFELLAGAPSPHGWALHRALEAMVEAAGVRRVRGEVAGFRGGEDRLEAAVVGEEDMVADAFVLASGRHIGGGLAGGRQPHEPLLGLEVFFRGRPAADDARLPHLVYLDSAPAFEAGLRTDAALRPVDRDGRIAYGNLRAAGALLGGWDPPAGGSAVPVLTGWLAGAWSAA